MKMLIIALLVAVLSMQSVAALSCAATSRKIGIVSNFSAEEAYYTIELTDVQSFNVRPTI